MQFRNSLPVIVVVLGVVGCAGPKEQKGGPLYFVSGDVVKVVYGEKEGQVACEHVAQTGSHHKESYCYTAEEIAERNSRNRRDNQLFGMMRCPDPALCKQGGG